MARGNLFANIENQYKDKKYSDLVREAKSHMAEILSVMLNCGRDNSASIAASSLLVCATVGCGENGFLSSVEKKAVEDILGEIFKNGTKDFLPAISKIADDSDYFMITSLVHVHMDIAFEFLQLILCFAYVDGKMSDSLGERLEDIFSTALMVDFFNSGEESVPAQKVRVSFSEQEIDILKWFRSHKGELCAFDKIKAAFPQITRIELKKNLDSLLDKGILWGGERIVGNSYGLEDDVDLNTLLAGAGKNIDVSSNNTQTKSTSVKNTTSSQRTKSNNLSSGQTNSNKVTSSNKAINNNSDISLSDLDVKIIKILSGCKDKTCSVNKIYEQLPDKIKVNSSLDNLCGCGIVHYFGKNKEKYYKLEKNPEFDKMLGFQNMLFIRQQYLQNTRKNLGFLTVTVPDGYHYATETEIKDAQKVDFNTLELVICADDYRSKLNEYKDAYIGIDVFKPDYIELTPSMWRHEAVVKKVVERDWGDYKLKYHHVDSDYLIAYFKNEESDEEPYWVSYAVIVVCGSKQWLCNIYFNCKKTNYTNYVNAVKDFCDGLSVDKEGLLEEEKRGIQCALQGYLKEDNSVDGCALINLVSNEIVLLNSGYLSEINGWNIVDKFSLYTKNAYKYPLVLNNKKEVYAALLDLAYYLENNIDVIVIDKITGKELLEIIENTSLSGAGWLWLCSKQLIKISVLAPDHYDVKVDRKLVDGIKEYKNAINSFIKALRSYNDEKNEFEVEINTIEVKYINSDLMSVDDYITNVIDKGTDTSLSDLSGMTLFVNYYDRILAGNIEKIKQEVLAEKDTPITRINDSRINKIKYNTQELFKKNSKLLCEIIEKTDKIVRETIAEKSPDIRLKNRCLLILTAFEKLNIKISVQIYKDNHEFGHDIPQKIMKLKEEWASYYSQIPLVMYEREEIKAKNYKVELENKRIVKSNLEKEISSLEDELENDAKEIMNMTQNLEGEKVRVNNVIDSKNGLIDECNKDIINLEAKNNNQLIQFEEYKQKVDQNIKECEVKLASYKNDFDELKSIADTRQLKSDKAIFFRKKKKKALDEVLEVLRECEEGIEQCKTEITKYKKDVKDADAKKSKFISNNELIISEKKKEIANCKRTITHSQNDIQKLKDELEAFINAVKEKRTMLGETKDKCAAITIEIDKLGDNISECEKVMQDQKVKIVLGDDNDDKIILRTDNTEDKN